MIRSLPTKALILLLTALLFGLPTPVYACFTPYLCLISPLCCPRPCPVKDNPRRARELVRAARNDTIEDQEAYEARQLADLVTRSGPPAVRATLSRPCPPLPPIALDPLLPRATATAPPPPQGYRLALADLSERTVADASDTAMLLAGYLSAADERLATAREATPDARDIRDLLRRLAELQSLINDIDAVERTAGAALARIHALPGIGKPPRTP